MSLINIIGNTISSGFVAVGATISDFLYYDPDPEFVNNASITNRGTSGTDAVGYSGKSYDFDGVSDFVDTGQTLAFERTQALKIECWVKIDISGNYCILSNVNQALPSTDDYRGLYLGINVSNQIEFFLSNRLNANSNILRLTSVNTITTNKWANIKLTYSGNSDISGVVVYIDDIPSALNTVSNSLSDTIITTQETQIGAFFNSLSGRVNYFNGQISDCSITINGTLVHQFEFNQASEIGVFDAVTSVLATNSGCALIESLSGFNYDPDVSEALKNNAGVYQVFTGGSDSSIDLGINPIISNNRSFSGDFLIFEDDNDNEILLGNRVGADGLVFRVKNTNSIEYEQFGVGGGRVETATGLVDRTVINEIGFIKTGNNVDILLNGVVVESGTVGTGVDSSSNVKLGNYVINNLDTLGGAVRNVTYIENGVTIVNDESLFSSFTKVNIHSQQFPEVGIPQSFSKNWNRYSSTSLTGTTSLSGTALTGSGTTFTTELAVNDIVRVAGNIARVTSVTDNTNAVVVNITSGSWSAQSTVRLRLGGSDQLLPEDANNAGFDIGGLAIVDPQPKFKLDGASYLEGEVLTIDNGDAFKFELDLVLYDLGTTGIIATNRDNANENKGVIVYRSSDNKLNTLISSIEDGVRWVKTTTLPAINTSYSLRFEVADITDINTYKIYIDDVEDTLTIEQNSGLMTTLRSIVLSIGQDSDGTLKLNGSIDNFKFNYL